jgi:hypothetical protein
LAERDGGAEESDANKAGQCAGDACEDERRELQATSDGGGFLAGPTSSVTGDYTWLPFRLPEHRPLEALLRLQLGA